MSDNLNPKEFRKIITANVAFNDKTYAKFNEDEKQLIEFFDGILLRECLSSGAKPVRIKSSSTIGLSDLTASTVAFGELIRRFNFLINSNYAERNYNFVKDVLIKNAVWHLSDYKTGYEDPEEQVVVINPEMIVATLTASTTSSAKRLIKDLRNIIDNCPLFGTRTRSEAFSNYGLANIINRTLQTSQRPVSALINKINKKRINDYCRMEVASTSSQCSSVSIRVVCSSSISGVITPPCSNLLSNLCFELGSNQPNLKTSEAIYETLTNYHYLHCPGDVPRFSPFDVFGCYSAAANYSLALSSINYILSAIQNLNYQIADMLGLR